MIEQTGSSRETIASAYSTIREQTPWANPGSVYKHHRVLPFATLSPWLNDLEFLEIYKTVSDHTLVDVYRCFELWTLAQQIRDTEGDILEVGVWRGGTGAILGRAVSHNVNKKVYLADTFAGVVKVGDKDPVYRGGEHSDTSLGLVTDFIGSLGLKNVELLQGIFPDDTQDRVRGKISMLHCDVDVYQSSREIVEWCLPRLVTGGIMVFDDYGFVTCEGVTRFCDELRQSKDFRFIHNLNGHAIFVKVA